MLLPTMTISEIKKEIEKDIPFLFKRMVDARKRALQVARMPIKQFPHIVSWQAKSYATNIVYNCNLLVNSKRTQNKPRLIVYTSYSHDDGTTLIEIVPEKGGLEYQFFTPHFFKRYKERMGLPLELTAQELYLRFRTHNPHSFPKADLIIQNDERYYAGDDIQFSGSLVAEGATICEVDKREPQIIIHNTFISREMFFETQEKKTKFDYITVMFMDFADNYPRQKYFLEKELYRILAEADERGDDEETLYQTVKAFIDSY